MKPFNIEDAKNGQPVRTRDGRSARVICFDRHHTYNLVALISDEEDELGEFESEITTHSSDGRYDLMKESDNDLFLESALERSVILKIARLINLY